MPRTVVFVSCAAESAVVSFRLDNATGVLEPLGRIAVGGAVEPPPTSMPLALSPDGRTLYAACRNPPFPVVSFAIGPEGGLSRTGSGHLAATMAYIATDRTGRFLFGASYYGARLSVNPIGRKGVPGDPVQVLETPPKAHSILPDPENRAVYAAVLGGDVILRQEFDAATGHLSTPATVVARTAKGAGPRHFRFARFGTLLYCLNELDGTLNAYARDTASGALTELQSVRLVAPPPPGETLAGADLHLTPDERFLYASERSRNVLAGFQLRADGTLEARGAVPAEPVPRGFAIDPRGRWLLCAGQETGRVAAYGIDARSGALTRLAEYPAGGNANWIEIIDLPALPAVPVGVP
jgi:6-phosphogluconolactonase